MQTVQTVQDIIDKRAKDRLVKDIQTVSNYLWTANYHLLGEVKVYIKDIKNEYTAVPLRTILLTHYPLADEIFENNIQKYLKEETEAFLNSFESLKEQMKELECQVDNIRND